MPQTDYSQYMDRGLEGLIFTAEPLHVRTGFNKNNFIPFGRIVVKGAGDLDVVLPTVTGGYVMGVATKTDVYERGHNANPLSISGYAANKSVNVLRKGTVLMLVETAVTPTSPVFFRHTANGTPGANEAIGRLRTNADTARADALPNCQFLETGAAGSLVKVAFNFD